MVHQVKLQTVKVMHQTLVYNWHQGISVKAENTHHWGKYQCTAGLQFY